LISADYTQGWNLHFNNPSSRYYFCWQVGILSWLEKWNPDALIVEANPRIFSTRLAISWMGRRGRPILGWGLGAPRSGNIIDGALRERFLKSLDGLISYSKRGEDEYRNLGINRVYTAYNAVSEKPTEKPHPRGSQDQDQPVLLFVGRLQERKRIDILLKACGSLSEEVQPKLIIVGDGPIRNKLEEMARIEYPQTHFAGAKYGDELRSYFDKADLFVLPGTGGLAVQQAMSRALPIVVAQGDGTQDDLVRAENGWQVEPGNQAALQDVILEALSDIRKLKEMGGESFRIVQEEINIDKMVETFIEAVDSVSNE
jgi:glycosyltransferase involved in cell wall biosynthesis